MHTTLWVRAATIAAAGVGALVATGTAWASTNAVLRSGQAPTTASAFPSHQCDADFGGGPYTDRDVWSFVLPSRDRDFITLTASFDTTGDGVGDTTVSTATSGGIKDDNGSSKAWISAPAGATLLGASGVVTGQETDGPSSFNISRTCPAAVPPLPNRSAPGASRPSRSPAPGTDPVAGPAGMPGRDADWSHDPSPVGDVAGSPDEMPPPGEGDEEAAEPGTAQAEGGHSRRGTSVALSTSALLAVVGSAGVLLTAVWRRRGRKRPAVIGRHRLLPDPSDPAEETYG